MVKKIVDFCIKQKGMIIVILAIIIAMGVSFYNSLPRSSFPKVTIATAVITIAAPGMDAESVEKEIATKVESSILSIDGYSESSSQSLNNACVVTLRLKNSLSTDEINSSFTDLRQKMEDISADLPSVVSSISINTDVADSASLILAITGDTVTSDTLSSRAVELRGRLEQIEGVSKVRILGNNDSEISVVVNNDALNKLNISLAEVVQTISNNNSILPIGSINLKNNNSLTVSTSGQYSSLEEIENLVVTTTTQNTIVHLKDIANIEVKEPDSSSYYLYNGEKSVVVAMYFQEGINIVNLGSEAREIVENFRKSLPENIKINEIYFQPDDVKNDIDNFVINLIEAIVIVLVIIMIGMNFRNGLVVSIAIPLAIFANFIVMNFIGEQIHFMSLTALIMVLGMLVDNSIVVSDSIQLYIDKGIDKFDACRQGTREVALSVFLSMLTAVLTFSSLLTLQGVNRQVIVAIPIVIISCLILSFVISIVVTPMFCYLFLKPTKVKKEEKPKLTQVVYNKISAITFRHKILSSVFAVVLVVFFGIIMTHSSMDLMPKVNKEYILIGITNYQQNNIAKTGEIVNEVQEIVNAQPETESCFSGVGIGIPSYSFAVSEKGESDSVGDLCVKIDLKKGNRFKTTAEMVDFLQKEIDANISDAYVLVSEIGIVPESGTPVGINVYGDNMELVNNTAEAITSILKSIPGVTAITSDSFYSTYDLYIDMDETRLDAFGLTKSAVQNELNIAVSGRTATTCYDNGKEYNINVKTDISSSDMLENYKVKSASGKKFLVKQFADFKVNESSNKIKHINGIRGVAIGGYAGLGYSSTSLQSQFVEAISDIDVPDGVIIDTEPDSSKSEAVGAMGTAGILSIVIIFFVLYLQFKSLKQLLLIFSSLPIGITSGLAFVCITGHNLSFFVILGIISMLGIVLANAIVLVDYINNEIKNGTNIDDACQTAGAKRLRPILMSTMTTVLGLIPLALSGQVLFVPLAILLMAALTFCMLFNLIMVPLLYSIIIK